MIPEHVQLTIAWIDSEIARLTDLRDYLRRLAEKGTALAAAVAETTPGKATPPAEEPNRPAGANGSAKPRPKAKASANGHAGSGNPHPIAERARQRRLKIARFLADGPKRATEIMKALDIPSGTWPTLSKHEWFRKSSPGQLSPYELTEAGREALDAVPQ